MSLRVATFRHTPHYFLCSQCLGNDNQTHIAETVSFEAREFGEDGVYLGICVFKNLVNVRTIENQAVDNLQVVCCVRCSVILGSKFVQLPPLFADRRGPFFHLNMDTVRYWDGNNSLAAEEGLPPMIAEAGQGEADPLHDPGHEAQVQADADPDNLGEDDIDEHLPGA